MEDKVTLYFEENWSKHFTSYPDEYSIELEWFNGDGEYMTDRAKITGNWNNGTSDFCCIMYSELD